jgi:putative chitinase
MAGGKAMSLITEEQLKKIFKNVKADKAKLYCEAFNKVFPRFEINTPKRIAAFLGQVGVESGELKYDKELPSKWNMKDPKDPNEKVGTLYEGRKPLGNTQPGDGPKFIGRGVLQLTGRANYTDYSKKLGVDLVGNPELAAQPEYSVAIACQYFKDRKLMEAADKWDLDTITERVNGKAKLHHEQRVAYSQKALEVLGG